MSISTIEEKMDEIEAKRNRLDSILKELQDIYSTYRHVMVEEITETDRDGDNEIRYLEAYNYDDDLNKVIISDIDL